MHLKSPTLLQCHILYNIILYYIIQYINVLQEADEYGNKAGNKSCHACPSGQAVVRADMLIAGKQYYSSLYLCQSCPDPLMTMTTGDRKSVV